MTFKDFMTNVLLTISIPAVAALTWGAYKFLGSADKAVKTATESGIEKISNCVNNADHFLEKASETMDDVADIVREFKNKGADGIMDNLKKPRGNAEEN